MTISLYVFAKTNQNCKRKKECRGTWCFLNGLYWALVPNACFNLACSLISFLSPLSPLSPKRVMKGSASVPAPHLSPVAISTSYVTAEGQTENLERGKVFLGEKFRKGKNRTVQILVKFSFFSH